MDLSPETNLVLIGMPGAGKSTIGVLLAKATARAFLDTDVHIQSREGRRLQEILDTEGRAAFCRIEERRILELHLTQHVIATGGSVVYSAAAMAHLKRNGLIVLLDLPFELLTRRLRDIAARGSCASPVKACARCTRSAARSIGNTPISPCLARC
jgi:shikimate kinase